MTETAAVYRVKTPPVDDTPVTRMRVIVARFAVLQAYLDDVPARRREIDQGLAYWTQVYPLHRTKHMDLVRLQQPIPVDPNAPKLSAEDLELLRKKLDSEVAGWEAEIADLKRRYKSESIAHYKAELNRAYAECDQAARAYADPFARALAIERVLTDLGVNDIDNCQRARLAAQSLPRLSGALLPRLHGAMVIDPTMYTPRDQFAFAAASESVLQAAHECAREARAELTLATGAPGELL